MSTTRKYTVESADSRDVVYGDDAVLDGTVLKIHRGGKLVGLFRDWRTVIAEDDQHPRRGQQERQAADRRPLPRLQRDRRVMSTLTTVHGERVLATCGGSVELVASRGRVPVVEAVIWTGWGITSRLVPVTDLRMAVAS